MDFKSKINVVNGIKYVSFYDFATDIQCDESYIHDLLTIYGVEWDDNGLIVDSLIKGILDKSIHDLLNKILNDNNCEQVDINDEYIYLNSEPLISIDCLFNIKYYSMVHLLMISYSTNNTHFVRINNNFYASYNGLKVIESSIEYYKTNILNKKNIEVSGKSLYKYKTYIIWDKTNDLYKIGRSGSPDKRLQDISSMNPSLSPILYINIDVESELHSKYSLKRHYGEWFRLSIDDLLDIYKVYKGNVIKNNLKHNK